MPKESQAVVREVPTDLLKVELYAAMRGKSRRVTYYQISRGRIPVWSVNHTWFVSVAEADAAFAAIDRRAA